MIRWMMMCSFVLLIYGCGSVSSTDFETSEFALDVDISMDVDLQETEFVIDLFIPQSRPVDLVGGDQIVVSYGEQRQIANRTGEGEYSAIFPLIVTGEYRIEILRPGDVSSFNTTALVNSYPSLLSPANGSSFMSGDSFELIWEARTNEGPTVTPLYSLEISAAVCADSSGKVLVSFDAALNPSIATIRDSTPATLNGTQYTRLVDVTTILDRLEDRNESEVAIQQCEIVVDIISGNNANVPIGNPNIDELLMIQPIIVSLDPDLAGGFATMLLRSNSAMVTLLR